MKKTFLALLCCSSVSFAAEIDVAPFRNAIKSFGGDLKSELQTAMKAGGPLKAIEICNIKAMPITEEHAQKLDWKIGRTSLKIRNPKNAPDKWETDVLNAFEQRKTNGEDPNNLEQVETITNADGSKEIRYMKAIPVAEGCLACHGEQLNPELAAKLKELYPDDQATGFKVGDLRGAFSISQPVK
ncbi:MAG: hypothetical protein RIT27_888 [Pseudomonadota bacterium]|jgi:hypothetical protein